MQFRNDIQGLRAIAVLLVILFHYNKMLMPGGYIGVDVFFVISGFLVTKIIKNNLRTHHFSFIKFYQSRFIRIVPSYLFMLVVSTIAAAILLTHSDFLLYQQSLKQALFFNSNQYFATFGSYFAPKTFELPLLHTWSLSIEMQFYFLLPITLIAISRIDDKTIRPYLWVSTACICLVTSLISLKTTSNNFGYFHLTTRAAEFIIGALITYRGHNQKPQIMLSLFGLGLIFSSAFLYTGSTHFPGVMVLLPCVGTYLIICHHSSQNPVTKLLSTTAVVKVGELSYQLYLWHWPILALLKYYHNDYQLSLSLSVLFLVLTFFCSYLSHYLIERKLKELKLNIRRLTVKLLGLGILLVPTSLQLNKLLTPVASIEMLRYADSNKICHGKVKGNCSVGNPDATKSSLLLGDSHGAQLNHFFNYLGKKYDFKTTLVTASSCMTYSNFDSSHIPNYSQVACKRQKKYANTLLKKYDTIYLAGMWSYHLIKNPNILNTLECFINTHKQTHQLILIGQVPQLKQNVRRFTRFKYLRLPAMLQKDEAYKMTNTAIKNLAKKHGVKYIDLASSSALQAKAFNQQQKPLYFDKSHLNEYGVLIVAKSLEKKFSAQVPT